MYGQGVEGLRRTIQNRLGRKFSASEALEYWKRFFEAYPGVEDWREKESRAFDAGYRYTRTRKGRRRLDVDTKPMRWNSPIQGLAADVLKAIAVIIYERREEIPDLEIVGLVHDEVMLPRAPTIAPGFTTSLRSRFEIPRLWSRLWSSSVRMSSWVV
jgi:DNA polymerase I